MTTPTSSRMAAFCVLSIGAASLLSSFASAQSPAELALNTPPALTSSASLPSTAEPASSTALPSSSSLPDAPEVAAPEAAPLAFGGQQGALSSAPVAKKYAMVIQPGQTAPRISKGAEFVAGFRDMFTPYAAFGWLAAEGYSYGTNGSPNYPQTGKGFAQGLGAAAARASSATLFYEAVLAPVLHEDPRYYRMGPGHNFAKRLVYSGTRVLLTRTDGGRQTLNIGNLGGIAAGSALTKAYYPDLNTSTTEVLKTAGGSVGGWALYYVAVEFLPDIFHHHR